MEFLKFVKSFNYIRVTLTILTVCSIVTFYGIWQILFQHSYIIKVGAKTDMDFVQIIKGLDKTDANCQDRLEILEEQVDTLFEFHKHDKVRAEIKYID